MFFNELLLLTHIVIIAVTTFIALRLGQSALVAFSVLQMILANMLVLKQTTLFGLNATCADAFIIGSLLSFNLLNELYGPEVAKRTIPTTFVFAVFYALMSYVHLGYIPSEFDMMHGHYYAIFAVAPWLIAGSIGVFLLAQIIDYLLYRLFKRLWPNYMLMVRNALSLSISQLFDTLSFSFILYWLGIITNVFDIVVVSYAIKMVVIAISTPLVTSMLFAHRWLEKRSFTL
jgi:queuosine precursor transporter